MADQSGPTLKAAGPLPAAKTREEVDAAATAISTALKTIEALSSPATQSREQTHPLPNARAAVKTSQQANASTSAGGSREVGRTRNQAAGSGSREAPIQINDMENEEGSDDEEDGEQVAEVVGRANGKSTRVRSSTVVYINGDAVLKKNLYDLEEGEPSVFDRELARGQGDAQYLKTQGATLAAPTRKAHIPKPHAPSAPRVIPPHQVARMSNNSSILKDAQADVVIRALYLSNHMDKLRKFVPGPVVEAINRMAATAPVGWKAAEPITRQPACITAELHEYQLLGLAWLVSKFDNGVNGILADEMGLGKTLQKQHKDGGSQNLDDVHRIWTGLHKLRIFDQTVQCWHYGYKTISLFAHLKFERNISGPFLVACPLSVLPTWMSELKKWCPSLRVVRLHSNDDNERQRLRKEVLTNSDAFDVAVTTYDTIKTAHLGEAIRSNIVWRYVVLDEAQKVKNEDSQISVTMSKIRRQNTLMLTGTPVQNNLHEVFALLNFMYPEVFTNGAMFDNAFDLSACKVDPAKLEAAHFLMRPFSLRRVKDEVDIRLPPKEETKINCPLSEMQTHWYRRLLMRDSKVLMDMEADDQAKGGIKFKADSGAWKRIRMLLVQLRKVCIHPYMFRDAEPDFDGETTREDIVEASGKMQVLDRMLAKLKANDHRVVLFSGFKITLDIIEDYLLMRGYVYRRLDGSTNRIQRMIDMEQFNKPGSNIFIYILTTRAGGLGVNLQTADTCILMDSDWNPQCDLQATARVYRIGQTKPVHIYRLISGGTVEDRVQNRAESKLYLDQMVNRGSTAAAEQMEDLSPKDMLSMLSFGADRIFKNDSGIMPSDADLDTIIDRSQMVAKALAQKTAAPASTDADEATGNSSTLAVVPTPNSSSSPLVTATFTTTIASAVQCVASTSAAGPDIASTSADQAVGGAAAMMLVNVKHTAFDFDAEQAPISTFLFNGVDFKALREQSSASESLNDIAKQWNDNVKRVRKERLVNIDGYDVLQENNYSMQEGGISIGIKAVVQKRKGQLAGTDYDHHDYCQVCWDGGRLLCCDQCPAAYHASCLGLASKDIPSLGWSCPHHHCSACNRSTAAAGGILLRCDMCQDAFCEDHLPSTYDMVGDNELFKALGQIHPTTAYFVTCTSDCKEKKLEMADYIDTAITELDNSYEERMESLKVAAAVRKKTGRMPQKAKGVSSAGFGHGPKRARGKEVPSASVTSAASKKKKDAARTGPSGVDNVGKRSKDSA